MLNGQKCRLDLPRPQLALYGSGIAQRGRGKDDSLLPAPMGYRRGPHTGGVYDVSPKGRQRRLAEHLVDRSHRGGVRRRRPPPWTLGQKALLVMSLAFIFAAMILAVAIFLLVRQLP